MQALILAGGEGTRLRPLTTTVPKPVVPLVDRPFIRFMLDWLRSHGVDDVVMSCGHLASGVRNVLGDGSAFGIRLRYVEEPRPLGTGGALKYAEQLLDDRFLMLNGDVLTDMDLTAQIAQHERTGARATLALTPVEDPSAYGLVRTRDGGEVTEFVEKPAPDQIDTRNISAGAYVLERSVLALLEPEQPASIERDVFPRLVGEGLYGFVSDGYWLDIGTPERYLEGTFDILEGTVASGVQQRMGKGFLCVEEGVENAGRIIPSALVESGCRIREGARIGGRVVLEGGVTVGENTTIERAVVMQGTEIGRDCTLSGCIIGGGVRIGDGCHVDGMSVLGEGVTIGDGNVVSNGARAVPGRDAARRRAAVLMARSTARRWPLSTRRARSTRSSTCTSTSRTRCGGCESASIAPVDAAGRPDRGRDGRVGGRRAAGARRDRARGCGGRWWSPTATSCRAGPGPTRWCCARATRARPRRRWPPTTTRSRAGRRGSSRRRAGPWSSGRAATACR